jgi:hypothetical protein
MELKPIVVRTGLSDGTRTEVLGDNVQEGLEIVVSDLSQGSTTATQQQRQNQLPFGVPQFGGRRGGF